jgi:hypothetical protein
MIPNQRARRIAAALVVPAMLFAASACGSDDEGAKSDTSASGPVATVSGKPGEQPKIKINEKAKVGAETLVTVLEEGDGPEVAKGDYLRLGAFAQTLGGEKGEEPELLNTWRPVEEPVEEGEEPEDAEDAPPSYLATQVGEAAQLPPETIDQLVGHKEGSRVVIEGLASELIGQTATQMGLSEEAGILWVFDIVTVIDSQGEAEGEQAEPEEGMPGIEVGEKQAAKITIPKGQNAPKELREQVLIEGDGAEVKAGQNLVAQYTGVSWEDGKQFDSSWDRKSAAMFGIGKGEVIAGWDEGLVGKKVGDRVLLVIPPDKGYGSAPDHDLEKSTLVFVVDILDAI